MEFENIYIDMCSSASEIQGDHWIPQQGDYCTSTNPDIGIGLLVARSANDWEMGNEFALMNDYLIFQRIKGMDQSMYWNNFLFDKKDFVFLPRSDQLLAEYHYIDEEGRLTSTTDTWSKFLLSMEAGTDFYSVYHDGYVGEWIISSYKQFAICHFMLDIYKKIWQDYEWKDF